MNILMENTILGKKLNVITISIAILPALENCRGVSIPKYLFKHTKSIRNVLYSHWKSCCISATSLLDSALSHCVTRTQWGLKLNSLLAATSFYSLWSYGNSPLLWDSSFQEQPGVNQATATIPCPLIALWLLQPREAAVVHFNFSMQPLWSMLSKGEASLNTVPPCLVGTITCAAELMPLKQDKAVPTCELSFVSKADPYL